MRPGAPWNNKMMFDLNTLGRAGLFLALAAAGLAAAAGTTLGDPLPPPAPMPAVPTPRQINSVPMGDPNRFPEVKLGLPVGAGPFQPTWASIEKNYPGTPGWLREAKFGIWVHFGPQASGESGDWYARNLYKQGYTAYENHLRKFGHPSVSGYKDVLRAWNPTNLDPAKLVGIYKQAGARFLIVQGVHCDNYDLWDSRYQPWNSTRVGPKRDLLGEWSKAAHAAGLRYGVSFHDEYTWYWWQTAFGADRQGPKAGVPYDGHLTPAEGKGRWWEGLDPRLLYGIDLREYEGVSQAADDPWGTPRQGIFTDHLAYARWYSTRFALRIMDVIEHYDPDFIYTDGTSTQPFSGAGSGSGYKSDAIQRVLAYYYNRSLTRRGKVDTFSIIKFRPRTNGTVNTQEFGIEPPIKIDQPWIAEAPVGDWYYSPGFVYESGMMLRYLIEAVARDGNAAVCVSLRPDGSLDGGSMRLLQEVGEWMRVNGSGIYGSRAWIIPGEGEKNGGRLRMLPGGKLGREHAEFKFGPQDFRFSVGKDGALYAFCLTVPEPGAALRITSLGTQAGLLNAPIRSVALLGSPGALRWQQQPDGLHVVCPAAMPLKTAAVFRIACAAPVQGAAEAARRDAGILSPQDRIVALKRTTGGGPNVLAVAGEFGGLPANEQVVGNLIDGDLYTKHFNSASPVGAGFVVTPRSGRAVIRAFRIATANDLESRDPLALTIEGSNAPDAAAAGASGFHLLYEGPCGLERDPGRNAWGEQVSFPNGTAYKSYRILVTKTRGEHPDAVQFSEIGLFDAAHP